MRLRRGGGHLTAWITALLLISSGAGAAVGAVLAARLIGSAPVVVTQAVRAQEPVVVGSIGNVTTFVGVDDSATKFTMAANMPQGAQVTFKLPLNNLSGRPLIVDLKLAVDNGSVDPAQVDVLPPDWAVLLNQLLALRNNLGSLITTTQTTVIERRAQVKIQMADQLNRRLGDVLGQAQSNKKKDARQQVLQLADLQSQVVLQLQQALELEFSTEGQVSIQTAISSCTNIRSLLDQLIARITADATTNTSATPVLVSINGFGGVTNIAAIGANEWKFELPPDTAAPAVDGLLVSLSAPPSGPIGFYKILADLHTVEF